MLARLGQRLRRDGGQRQALVSVLPCGSRQAHELRGTRAFANVASAAALLRAGRRAAQPASGSAPSAALRSSSLQAPSLRQGGQNCKHKRATHQACSSAAEVSPCAAMTSSCAAAASVVMRCWQAEWTQRT